MAAHFLLWSPLGARKALLGAVWLAALWARSGWAQTSVDSVGITVGDMERAVQFYSDVLTFEPVAEWEVFGDAYERAFGVFGMRLKVVRMRLGDEVIELMEFLAPRGRPIPIDSRSNDLWFQHIAIVVSDMDRAYARLREHDVEHASSGPQVLPDWNPDAGGISAFYFHDPDGNHLEVLAFPADKGAAKWHAPTDRVFLGIDHTAIVVADTDASLAFYRDTLGLEVAGVSENYGIEQERLNSVFGARLRITGLRAAEGIGVELLEYLAPRTGRLPPVDSQSNDLWHWQVNVVHADIEALDAEFRQRGYRYVSSGIVVLGDQPSTRKPGGRPLKVLMVRDPDGHASLVAEPRASH